MRITTCLVAGGLGLVAMMLVTLGALAGETKGDLLISITGFENSNGTARVAIVNSENGYTDDILYRGFSFGIMDNRVVKTIESLPYGEYAIKVYHDENSNDELDMRMFGIPAERYGFSNNARGTFGPPDYGDVKFTVDSSQTVINIEVK